MRKTTQFKALLAAPQILMIPVAHDPLCAKILQRAGFKAVGCAGYANSAALLGASDVELLPLTEMVEAVWRMSDAVGLPVWANADRGHGNTTNVRRTIRQIEKAGAAAIMLEDQVSPQRSGYVSCKHVVRLDEFVSQIKAAVDARHDDDFTILARTDAIGVNGLDDAVDRAYHCLEAGADWVSLEVPENIEQVRRIPRLIDAPTLANMIPNGRTPILAAAELQAIGFDAVVWPSAFTYIYAKAAQLLADELKCTGTIVAFDDRMIEVGEFDVLIGPHAVREAEAKYCRHRDDAHKRS